MNKKELKRQLAQHQVSADEARHQLAMLRRIQLAPEDLRYIVGVLNMTDKFMIAMASLLADYPQMQGLLPSLPDNLRVLFDRPELQLQLKHLAEFLEGRAPTEDSNWTVPKDMWNITDEVNGDG